jgi:hypothetical protein
MSEVHDVLNTGLAWLGTDQVRLAIGTGRTQVVAFKGLMTVALWCCNDSKVGSSLSLKCCARQTGVHGMIGSYCLIYLPT